MAYPRPSRAECEWAIEVLKSNNGNKLAAAREANLPETSFRHRLEVAEREYNLDIPQPPAKQKTETVSKGRRFLTVTDGSIFVGGDAHYWPGEPSTAHRAFVHFIKREKKLAAVVMNGDAYDFPNISRHDVDWTSTPTVREELEVVDERLTEIVKASGKAPRYHPLGNHDARFERYLAMKAPEMKGVPGTRLRDRNPLWEPCYSLFVNDGPDGAVIKHRHRGGAHATSNNVLYAGRTMVTNHLHALQCRPHTDYNGTRWGVDAGCLADVYGPQFSYLEDNVRSWRAGFVRLSWVNGRLLTPELIRVVEPDLVEFRGELITV